MRRTKFTTAAASMAVAASLVLTGCGSDEPAAPQAASSPADVREAFAALADSDSLGVDFSLDASDQIKEELSTQAGPEAAPIVGSLLEGSFSTTVTLTDGQTFREYAEANLAAAEPSTENVASAFAFNSGGAAVVDIRLVDNALFVAADTAKISEMIGINIEQYLVPQVAGSPMEPAVNALVEGKFVSVSADLLKDATSDAAPATANDMDPEEISAALDAFGEAFDDTATVNELDGGVTEVTVKTEPFLNALFDAAEANPQLAAELELGEREEALEDAKEIPEVTFEVTIVDGKVTELVLPIAQLLDDEQRGKLAVSGKGRFALVVSFDTGSPVQAPADAVNIDDVVTTLQQGGMF